MEETQKIASMKNFVEKLKTAFHWARKTTFFLYLATILLSLPFANFPAAINKARGSALSRLIPQFEHLLDVRDGKITPNKERLKEYFIYFQKVDEYLPDKVDVLASLGYCAYYLGKEKDALVYYTRAILGYPDSLAFYYNLGALHFKKGEYAHAIKYLSSALKTSFVQNLSFISSSRLYFPLIKDPAHIDRELAEYIKTGYERCYRLLVLSYERLNDPANELVYAIQATAQPVKDPAFLFYKAGTASYKN
jgi:tetratricopeptide (TPR) repeat protein